jgi:hypothetical protein
LPGIGFRAARGGGATARFGATEAVLLRGLVSEVADLIGEGQPGADGSAGPAATPADLADTRPLDTGPPNTGPLDTGPLDTGLLDTGPLDTGLLDTGPADAETPDSEAPQPPDPTEAAIEEMLGLSSSTRRPDDPILARLFPDGYSDDEQASGEFRRYTERGLRSGKMAAAQTILDTLPESGGRVDLSPEQAQAWLRSLNDIRLALGVQLDVTEDMRAMQQRAAQGGPQAAAMWVYDWLSLLQESLVHALW